MQEIAPSPATTLDPTQREIARRRTFAIISHPDAGKTTLTEKLLLFGGAIQLAGHVRARGERRRTRSDWMEIEQARGISVTSSVMTFERDGTVFNLLDTPGHEDFSEDTYRTLTAVDAAVMVIDAAKGIESQTRKLFEVCRLRDIPIVTFINKVDREGQDPLALLDEIASALALDVVPMTWPVGMGGEFQGCLDALRQAHAAAGRGAQRRRSSGRCSSNALEDILGDAGRGRRHRRARRSKGSSWRAAALPEFDLAVVPRGPPDAGVLRQRAAQFRRAGAAGCARPLGARAAAAQGRPSARSSPSEKAVTGFVFKVQANMDPNHRDRVAFLRLCSGRFRRGMKLHARARGRRSIAVAAPILFFAQQRETADEAFAGDIIGIPNHGTMRVGDTLHRGRDAQVPGHPELRAGAAAPRRLIEDAMKAKQLNRALHDLAEEGVVQVFQPVLGSRTILGVVGALQFDVLQSRLQAEYGVPVRFETAPCVAARWVQSDDKEAITASSSATA